MEMKGSKMKKIKTMPSSVSEPTTVSKKEPKQKKNKNSKRKNAEFREEKQFDALLSKYRNRLGSDAAAVTRKKWFQ